MDETLPAGWPAYSLFTALRNEEGLPLAWVWSPVPCPAHGPGAAGIAAPAWAFAWTTYLVPAWSMDQAGGSRDRPLMVLLAWAMCLVRRMDRGLSGWSTMTVRPYMVLRVGRMIGPACGPLVHSHDVDRKRAGHVGGPPASTWSIWPLVQGPGLRPWPTRRGLIVDRAVLDGPWSWLTPSSASDRPVRPTADTRRLRQDLFILRVACVCSIESGPCERVDVFHVSGRFWSTSACGEKRTPARPAWTSFPS